MLKKIVFYSLVFNIALFTNVKGAESGGMPQLNPEFWISQIFWLVITFSLLFVILSKFILPKISKNIEFAEKQKVESENKIKEYESLILKSKNESRNYFNETRKKILQDIDKKIIQLEKAQNKLDSASSEAEIISNQAKKDSEKLIIEMNEKFHSTSEIKKNLAQNKIKQMKETALKDIKNASIKIATDSVRKILSSSIDKSKLDNLFATDLEQTKNLLKKINS